METLGSFAAPGVTLPQARASDAINELKDHSNGEIFAWLAFVRSIQPNFRYVDSIGSLPCKLITAVLALRSWSDPAIVCSLQWARLDGMSEASPQESLPRMTETTDDLDTSTITNWTHPCFGSNPFRSATNPDDNWKRNHAFKNGRSRVRKHKRVDQDNLYWCTVCGLEDPHSYKARDQWKKHEESHEINFECRSIRLLESMKKGDPCELCGESSPDYDHIGKHNVETCLGASSGPPSFKRRYQMVAHLRDQHACVSSRAVAERWRVRSSKQAWSCGFCVALFTNIKDRLKHIDVKHFKRRKSLSDWSSTKVVEGLLLQPEIKEVWRALLDTKDPLWRKNLIWTPDALPDLQRRLELGVTVLESAEELARAAYEAADFDYALHHAANIEANNPATDFRPPPPTVNRAKASNKPWNPTILGLCPDYSHIALPIAQSAARSWYSGATSGGIPSLYTGASLSENQSDTETILGQWPETCRDEDGFAGMICDDDVKANGCTMLQSYQDDFHEIIREDTFDGFSSDHEQYFTGMPI